jgi:hypothetical protein
MGDEFGSLGSGPNSTESPFFGVGTVGFTDLQAAYSLVRLGRDLRRRAGATIGRYFSAKSDRPRTRAEVFEVLQRHCFFVDATYVDRRDLPDFFRNDPLALYRALWSDHLLHTLPGVLAPETIVYIHLASIHSDTRQRHFHRAYGLATGLALIPFYVDYLARHKLHSGQPSGVLTVRELPALAIAEVDPRSNRLAQVADYCLWAIHRELRRLPDSHRAQLSQSVRSIRQVVYQPVSESLCGVAQPTGDLALDCFLPVASYSVGPADSFQALHSARQAALADDAPRVLDLLRDVNAADLHRQGRSIHQKLVTAIAQTLRGRGCDDEILALLHLTFATESDNSETIKTALLRSASGWQRHPQLAIVALRRLQQIVDARNEGPLMDATKYLLALRLQALGLEREARRVYAEMIASRRDREAISPPWACASVNLARAASLRSPQYARALLQTMLASVPDHKDYQEPKAKGSLALSHIEDVGPRRRELLNTAERIVKIYSDQEWIDGFDSLLEQELSAQAIA